MFRVVSISLGWVGCLFLVSGLSGCVFSVGPDYQRPSFEHVPDRWTQAAADEVGDPSAPLHNWWATLEDPTLAELLSRAHHNNLSIQAAVARVSEARAALGIARADRVPKLEGTGSVERQRDSDGVSVAPPPQSRTDTLRQLGVEASWEWDLWGRVRRTVEAERALLEAEQEDLRDVLVVVYADVGTAYVNLRALQERLRLAIANVDLQKETLALVAARNRAQLAPDSEVRQAELNVAVTESNVPDLRTAIAQTLHQLSVLLGEPPSTLIDQLSAPVDLPEISGELRVSAPADTIRQRPDIRAAERNLAAQTALIGVATAELYPNFFLSGDFGFATAVGSLTDSAYKTWGLGSAFSWNLFNAGKVRNAIRQQEALTDQALINYELTVLTALQDVEDSLVAYFNEQERRAALARSVVAAEQAAELVRELYRRGLTDFQNVLDAQRSLFGQQDDLAASEGDVLVSWISVYRAFGGGWAVLGEAERKEG